MANEGKRLTEKELREKKLELEIKELEKKWFQRPSFQVPIIGALVSLVFYLFSGLYSAQTTILEAKQITLLQETDTLEKRTDSLILESKRLVRSVELHEREVSKILLMNDSLECEKERLQFLSEELRVQDSVLIVEKSKVNNALEVLSLEKEAMEKTKSRIDSTLNKLAMEVGISEEKLRKTREQAVRLEQELSRVISFEAMRLELVDFRSTLDTWTCFDHKSNREISTSVLITNETEYDPAGIEILITGPPSLKDRLAVSVIYAQTVVNHVDSLDNLGLTAVTFDYSTVKPKQKYDVMGSKDVTYYRLLTMEELFPGVSDVLYYTGYAGIILTLSIKPRGHERYCDEQIMGIYKLAGR